MSGASELVEGREVFDPFLNKTVKVSDKLTDRLRGRYAIGPTMDNGEPEFGWREFTTPPIQHEAADELARLSSAHSEAVEDARKHLAELSASRAEVVALREALEEAARRFEGLSHIHDGNPSDAMADTPPLDYARHMLWEARRECREGAREARAALSKSGEKP